MNTETGEIRNMSDVDVLRLNAQAGKRLWVPVLEDKTPRSRTKSTKVRYYTGQSSKPKNADLRHLSRSERKKLKG